MLMLVHSHECEQIKHMNVFDLGVFVQGVQLRLFDDVKTYTQSSQN